MAPHTTTSNIGAIIYFLLSLLASTVGLRAILFPSAAAATFGIPISPSSWHFVVGYGIRNFTMGIGNVVLLLRGERRAAGLLACVGVITCFADAWLVASAQGSWRGEAVGHVGFAPVTALVGWALMS